MQRIVLLQIRTANLAVGRRSRRLQSRTSGYIQGDQDGEASAWHTSAKASVYAGTEPAEPDAEEDNGVTRGGFALDGCSDVASR
jgi:hypothetical protein